MQYIYILYTKATNIYYCVMRIYVKSGFCEGSKCKHKLRTILLSALFVNECFVICCLSVDMLYSPSEVSKRCQKYASGVHISSTVNIVYVGSEQTHYLDSRECCAHRATYSCLGNINHFILTTDFSYCENPLL